MLDLLVDGLSNKQVAKVLFISPRTASVYVSKILKSWELPHGGKLQR